MTRRPVPSGTNGRDATAGLAAHLARMNSLSADQPSLVAFDRTRWGSAAVGPRRVEVERAAPLDDERHLGPVRRECRGVRRQAGVRQRLAEPTVDVGTKESAVAGAARRIEVDPRPVRRPAVRSRRRPTLRGRHRCRGSRCHRRRRSRPLERRSAESTRARSTARPGTRAGSPPPGWVRSRKRAVAGRDVDDEDPLDSGVEHFGRELVASQPTRRRSIELLSRSSSSPAVDGPCHRSG